MCRYVFNQEKTILSMPCDCTLMGGNFGRCPLANSTTFQSLASKMRTLYNKISYCHTSDRDNLLAYPDCSPYTVLSTNETLKTTTSISDSDWIQAVELKSEIEIFPQLLGEYQNKCLTHYYPHTLTNYKNTFYKDSVIEELVRTMSLGYMKELNYCLMIMMMGIIVTLM